MIDLEDEELEEGENLTEDQIREKIHTFASTKLADVIIMARYIGLYKDLSVDAMKELGARRAAGDSFKFEEYIEDNLNKLPKLNFTIPSIQSLIGMFKGFGK